MILFLGAAALLLLLIAYGLVSMLLRLKKLSARNEDRSNVGFVVDTFHTLMAQLKEKEKELQELRAQAEQRAGIAEDYNENILQSVPSGVISLDDEGRVVKVNSSAERILQVLAEELHESKEPEVLREFLKSGRERGLLQYRTRAGRPLWLDYSLTPLSDSGGRHIGRLLVFTDLTELKALEAQSELRERLSSLGEMAAGIAHELRNPMGVISGYMRLLSKKVDSTLQPTVDSVSREVSGMERIISDFLSFARPGEPSYSDVPLRPFLEECLRSSLSSREGIRSHLDVGEDIILHADETQIRQVFTNLFINAAEAQEGKGIVSVSARRNEDSVLVRVTDSGPGIDEAVRERIFQPFFTTKDKGTGLGLALVHRIITVHGGSIVVQSPPEGGTRFVMRFPVSQG